MNLGLTALARSRQAVRRNGTTAVPARDLRTSCSRNSSQGQSLSIISTVIESNSDYRRRTSNAYATSSKIFTFQVLSASQNSLTRNSGVIRPCVAVSKEGSNVSLQTSSSFHTFSSLRTGNIVLVSRQGDSSQDTDNGDNDHQLDQGKTFLYLFQHDIFLLKNGT